MYVEVTPFGLGSGQSISVNSEQVLYVRKSLACCEIVFRGGDVLKTATPHEELIALLEAAPLDGANSNWQVLG